MAEQLEDESNELEEQEEAAPETSQPSRRGRRPQRAGRRPSGPRRYRRDRPRRPRQCAFCVSKVAEVDYKQVDILRPYVTDRGKIRPRRQTGLCAKHQRKVTRAIKRARHLALLPFTTAGQGRFPG